MTRTSSPLADGLPAPWASAWGGDFVDFTLGEVVQRLRWVPAGTFLMSGCGNEPSHGSAPDLGHGIRHDDRGWCRVLPHVIAIQR